MRLLTFFSRKEAMQKSRLSKGVQPAPLSLGAWGAQTRRSASASRVLNRAGGPPSSP